MKKKKIFACDKCARSKRNVTIQGAYLEEMFSKVLCPHLHASKLLRLGLELKMPLIFRTCDTNH